MSPSERLSAEAALMARAGADEVDEATAIEILRSPYCTVQIADRLAHSTALTSRHRVCELLCMIRGMPASRVHDLVSNLPWGYLLRLSQAPKAPPMVRRVAERRLLVRLPKLTLGEKISVARRAHRALFPTLMAHGGREVFGAMLENPRMTEADVVKMLRSAALPVQVVHLICRNLRWSRRRRVRMAIARSPAAPLPVALAALAEFGTGELRELMRDPKAPAPVRDGARRLFDRRSGGRLTPL